MRTREGILMDATVFILIMVSPIVLLMVWNLYDP